MTIRLGGDYLYLTHQLKLMGTQIDIAVDATEPQKHLAHVVELLHHYKQRFSANDWDSELMVINDKAGIKEVVVNSELYDLIALGKYHSLAQPSNLNIAIGPLVQTWRIGFSDARLPAQDTIAAKMSLTNPRDILLNPSKHSVYLRHKGMKIDLGALAKGYIADQVIAYLARQAATAAFINLGGNVLVYGDNPKRADGFWFIGIQDPDKPRGQIVGRIKLKNQSVVTSGIYERRLVVKGRSYHHLFDRVTGYPIQTPMASLTVVAAASIDCEIWTTRLFGLPINQALELLNQTPGIEGLIITKDRKLLLSDGLGSCFYAVYQ